MKLEYSKGTLVLSDLDSQCEQTLPKWFFWDERINHYRAPAMWYRRTLESFSTSNINISDDVKSLQQPANKFEWQDISLYPHQQAAGALWDASGKKGIIVLPTGGGKTRIAMDIIRRAHSSTLILVPTRALLTQWQKSLSEFYQGPIGVIGDGEFDITTITVSTYESAYRHISKLGSKFQLVVVDEVHHFGCGIRDEILRMSTAPFRLGLTASLPIDESHRRKIHSLVGPVSYEATIGDLKGEYLSDYDHLKLEVSLNRQEADIYATNYGRYQDFSNASRWCWQELGWATFAAYASRSNTGIDAMKSLRVARACVGLCESKINALKSILKRHWNEQVFVFVATTAEVCRIAKMLLAYPIVADVKRNERDAVLQKFQQGFIRAIVACKVLNEGIDIPSASVAVILGGSSQPLEHIQRVGRVLRKSPDKKAVIYELVAKNTFEVRKSHKRNSLMI